MEEKVKIIIFVCLFVVCGVPIRYFFLYSVFRFSTSLYLRGIFAPLLEAIEMDFFLSFRSTRWRWYGNLCGIIHWWCWFSGGDWGEQKWQWRALVKTERQAKKKSCFYMLCMGRQWRGWLQRMSSIIAGILRATKNGKRWWCARRMNNGNFIWQSWIMINYQIHWMWTVFIVGALIFLLVRTLPALQGRTNCVRRERAFRVAEESEFWESQSDWPTVDEKP